MKHKLLGQYLRKVRENVNLKDINARPKEDLPTSTRANHWSKEFDATLLF